MSTILFIVGVFLYYLLVLRRFNTVGFRLFSGFAFLSVLLIFWTYSDERKLAGLEENGEHIQATVLSKRKISSEPGNNMITIVFSNSKGIAVKTQTSEYISDDEWASFKINGHVNIIYDPNTGEVFASGSVERFKNDSKKYKWIEYLTAGIFFTIGCIVWVVFRKYKVGVHENGDEYIEKDGKIIIDKYDPTAGL